MRIDLTCPVELWRFQLPTEAFPACAFLLYNLSEKPVTSVQVTLICLDENGETASRHVERLQGLKGDPQTAFEIAVPVEPDIPFADMELIIEKVWFDDNTIWRRGNASLTEYEPNALPNNRRLEMLRFVAGEDAVGYPQDQGPVWLCVCGRANAASEDACRRCGRDKAETFENCNQAAIDAMILRREEELAAIARKAREDASEKERLREEALARKRRRRRRIIAAMITLLLVGAAAYGVIWHGLPYYRYLRANEQLETGLYDEARATFAAMADYRDAPALVLACDYAKAQSLLETGTEETLVKAQAAFTALGEYKDSAELAQKACYNRAVKRMTAKDYTGAAALFEEVSSYSDARLKISECHYARALTLMDAGDYSAAREIFLTLGDYSESVKMATECLYRPGVAAMEEARWTEALTTLEQIPDYLDVPIRIQTIHYQIGESLTAEGKYQEAGDYYIAAGDYLDASRKAGLCWYEQAKALMENGQYSKAADMFQQISGYEDSQALGFECVYQIAAQAKANKEYSRAYDLFLTILSHEDAQDQAKECLYLPAMDAIGSGKYDDALAYLMKLPEDYKDVSSQIKEIHYRKAAQLLKDKDYEGAYAAFTQLTPYSDSSEQAKAARYAQVKEAMDARSYVTALQYLADIADYKDAAALADECHYRLALNYLEEGQTQQALSLLDALGDYEDAQTRVSAIRYADAQAVLAEGDYAAAAELFMRLEDYEDAETQYKTCLYKQAEAVRAGGDMLAAGRLFEDLGKFEDAGEQAESCFDAYYAAMYQTAADAMEAEDYPLVIETLKGMDLNDPPKKYGDVNEMYDQANYALANQLYADDKPYEALVYYRNIPDYKDVSSKKLKRNCYLVLGKWISNSGVSIEFRDNGTCVLDGEELYFSMAGTYSMLTGTDPADLSATHKVSRVDSKSMTLRDLRGGKTVTYKLTKVVE